MRKILFGIVAFLFGAVSMPAQAAMCDYDGNGVTDAGWSVVKGVCVPASATVGNLSDKPLGDIVSNMGNFILGVAGVIAILGFLISGILYFTAAGDEEKAKTAKQALWYSLIGAVISLGALVIMNVIDNFLKANVI